MQEFYNINFLLTNQNSERKNQLIDSFINIYASVLYNLKNVDSLNISPNHHFVEEFKDFIENYSEVETYLSSNDKTRIMLIKGIRAINVLYNKEIAIYINPYLNYIDENIASFGISESNILGTKEDSEIIYEQLNKKELEIVDWGIIKGAEKVTVLVKKPR